MSDEAKKIFDQDYQYDFKTNAKVLFTTGKGLNEEVVREISKVKNEPEWMLEYRLKALEAFFRLPMPSFGPDLSFLDFPSYTYYTRVATGDEKSWNEVPPAIKDTFQKLGIPEQEQKFLSGVTTQYESEVVYHNMLKEVDFSKVSNYDLIDSRYKGLYYDPDQKYSLPYMWGTSS